MKHFKKIQGYLTEILNHRLKLFRVFTATLALDIIAIFILGSLNPLQLINPLQFLLKDDIDIRNQISLFFPRAFEYNEQKNNEEINIIEVRQAVSLSVNTQDHILDNVKMIISELIKGPNHLVARRFIKDPLFVKKLWLKDEKTLVIHINKEIYSKMNIKAKKEIKACFEKSLLANISFLSEIIWTSES